jgi:predicted amidohydrolase
MPDPQIAVLQFNPVHGAVSENRARSFALLAKAAAAGANIAVLPECAITGYVFDSVGKLMPLAESLQGKTVAAWSDAARTHNMWVIGGLIEEGEDVLYNTAVVISPDGTCQRYRKLHLWDFERDLYDPGGSMLLVDTPWGKVGVAICYDLWFPELIRAMALAGATLVVLPSNWAGNPRHRNPFDAHGLPMGCHMAIAAACANEITIAVADRTGAEGDLRFLGSSCIVGPDGRFRAGPASRDEDAVLLAPWVNPAAIRSVGQSHLASRRNDIYSVSVLLGSSAPREDII